MRDVYFYKLEKAIYPTAPFNPSNVYPELRALSYTLETDMENEVYNAVREVLIQLGLDQENIGTEQWNPFRGYVKPGEKVLIKPNLVYHTHPYGDEGVLSMVTNAAVLRPIVDYVLLATEGNCVITIGDASVQGADFQEVVAKSGLKELLAFYEKQGIEISLVDMRMLISVRNKEGILSNKYRNPKRTETDYTCVDLKEKTELYDIIENYKRFEITDYGYGSVAKHHNKEKNEYMIPKEVLEADFFINIPKLKTHRKAGMTCALKNIVGINGDKTCLAHHTRGVKGKSGDEFSQTSINTITQTRIWTFLKTNTMGIKIASKLATFFSKYVWKGQSIKEHRMNEKPKVFSEGSWYGNDTLWRCVKDLNKIILYADKCGNMQEKKQREYFCIVDAVLAGEKEGPMEQTTKEFGVIFGGSNAVYIDYCAAKLMKYDYNEIPLLKNSFCNKWWNLVEKKPTEVVIEGNLPLKDVAEYFIPSYGWMDKLVVPSNGE